MSQEKWKSVQSYNGKYLISSQGRIKSLYKKRLLRPHVGKDGYVRIVLWKEGKQTIAYIHRLVASAFVPNPHNFQEINHIDGNKQNNSPQNLEWVTRSENVKHAIKKLGKNIGIAPTPVLCKETGEVFASQMEASRRKKIPQGNISISIKKERSVGGLTWVKIKNNFTL